MENEWHKRYVARLMKCGLPLALAEADYEAGLDDCDFEDDPEDAADESLSYWAADC